ncbi:threonyl-tRNA synthetase editing domain-containing protein [Halovenus marina]|uniref:threonyl-tRNA synthetase editing domain-containing protein n=1 Tax=Halovenus marina TaxID=3396621 RepID=UPI003F54A3B4
MHLLFVHADRFGFEWTGEGDPEATQTEGQLSECVVVFATVEAGDTNAVIGATRAAVESVASQLKADRLAVYPTTHLSETAASAERAVDVLDTLESTLEDDYEVLSVPRGWGKRVELTRKGHPHAVQSRQISSEDHVTTSRDREWRVLSPDGRIRPVSAESADVSQSMQRIIDAERDDSDVEDTKRSAYEAALTEAGFLRGDGDSGEMTLTPRGTVVRDVLYSYIRDQWTEHGAVPVDDPRAWSQRVAVSDGDLPVSLVGECGRRDNESGETVMLWTVTAGGDSARTRLRQQVGRLSRLLSTLGVEFDPLVRIERESIEGSGHTDGKTEPWLSDLGAQIEAETPVELVSEPVEWTVRVEFVTAGTLGEALGPPTIQVETGQRETAAGDANSTDVTAVSCSVPIDSLLVALGARAAETDRSQMPTWLAPTQVRLIPVEASQFDHCEQLAETLAIADVRVDIDDRDKPVGTRIEAAERAWMPYYAVVGDDEIESDRLAVFDRAANRERSLTVEELYRVVQDDSEGFPRQRQSLPRRVSDLLAFV